ncbi:MAG: hypothetical protein FWG79_09445 [Bacteroidales bacterium]|nr:hypothetical protein [Bacteroidales bacterium]
MTDKEYADTILEMASQVQGEFAPFAFPNEEGDCIEFFVSPKDYYAKRVDDYLTLYLEEKTGDVAGFVIKNITWILDNVSSGMDCSFVIRDGEMCLEAMFAAMVWSDERRITFVREYRRVANLAKSHHLDKIRIPSILEKAGITTMTQEAVSV